MPNHVTNKLTITGTKEQIDAFEAEFITPRPSDTDPCVWSFEKLVPMPPILRRVVESNQQPVHVYELVEQSWDSPSRPATPDEIAEIAATGYPGWYRWSLDNWGTKWDAYNCSWSRDSDTQATLVFDTAWSCPEPVFEAMAAHSVVAPLHITIRAFDEGWNFGFEGTIADGTYEGNDRPATPELYEQVYGEPPEHDEEDDDDADTEGQ